MIKKFNNYISEANENDPYDEEIWDDSNIPQEKNPRPAFPPHRPFTDLQQVVGQTIESIVRTEEGEAGFLITFNNGSTLEVGYDFSDGMTKFDDIFVNYPYLDEDDEN